MLNIRRQINSLIDNILSEEQLLQSTAKIGTWHLDVASGKCKWSEELLKIYGLPEDNNTYDFDYGFKFIHPEDTSRIKAEIDNAFERHIDVDLNFRIINSHGETKYLHSKSKATRDLNGTNIGVYGYLQDVTSEQISRIKSELSEANLRAIFESSEIGYGFIDCSFKVVTHNELINSLFGKYQKHKLSVGEDFINCILANQQQFYKIELTKAFNGMSLEFETTYSESNGGQIYFEINIFPVKVNNCITGAGIAIRNINSRKKIENQLIETSNHLKHQNEEISKYSYSLSHILRAPVASMIGLCNLLKEHNLSEDKKLIIINNMSRLANDLDTIVRQMNIMLEDGDKSEGNAL